MLKGTPEEGIGRTLDKAEVTTFFGHVKLEKQVARGEVHVVEVGPRSMPIR